jgi:TRAP-type C4-dicarboxylate transport system permease small subunit
LLVLFGGESALGDYQAAVTFSTIIGYAASLAFALYPKMLAEECPAEVEASFKNMLMLALPMAAVALTMSTSLLTILNASYSTASPILILLAIDALIASGIILQFAGDFNTAAYAAFAYIIAEAAIRFELIGSLSALMFFILGLYGAYMYRKTVYDLPFSYTGYAYWTILMAVIAASIGTVVRVLKNQREQNERYLIEITRVFEQKRIAHDINVKNIAELENMEPLSVREKEVVNLTIRMDVNLIV